MLNSNRNTQFKNITEGLAFIEVEGDKSFNKESKVVFEIFKVLKNTNYKESI